MARNRAQPPRLRSVSRSHSRSPTWRSPSRIYRSRSRSGHESRYTRDRHYSRSSSRLSPATPKPMEELPPLPFAHQHRNGKSFYVRECYSQYFKLVKEILADGTNCVTVTGTPGIGKSVFYAYFFLRHRKEESKTWIIAAAYHRNNLILATVFKGGDNGERLRPTEDTILDVLEEAAARKEKVIFLCDGAPPSHRGECMMVVFTDPDEEWLRAVRKDYSTIFMPLWTFKELQRAALVLRLAGSCEVSDDALQSRFNTLGGVARECLMASEDFVECAKRNLLDEIKRFTRLEDLRVLIKGVPPRGIICHRVLHCYPVDAEATRKVASPFVVEKLAKRMELTRAQCV